MKLSIIIPVYFNQDSLELLYRDIETKVIEKIDFDYEIVMVNDGSLDNSYEIMKKLAKQNPHIKVFSLSRNFGSHAAILCGLSQCTGDCAVVKAADLQEPTELILQMVEEWKKGNNVVLGVREARQEGIMQIYFANLYYDLIRKFALKNMPKGGFDVYLLDRKVINVLLSLDEVNSALTGQILWSGFKTSVVPYTRLAREIGESKWTFRKKLRLVLDSFFSFSTLPISIVTIVGCVSFIGAIIWGIIVFFNKIFGYIQVSGWTTLFIFNLLSFGIIMLTMGVFGGYLWRIFDSSRNRPTFIIEEEYRGENEE